ncbi:MAG: hypothetical protein AAGD96_20695 [Chloroflexota bacterium]
MEALSITDNIDQTLTKWTAWLSSAGQVAGLTAAFYLVFTLVALWLHGGDPLWFVWIGDRFADLNPAGQIGYDGQFIYYIASMGIAEGAAHLDIAPYRLQRIFYPMLVRTLSGGQAILIPWVMLAINFAIIVAATWSLAEWFKKQGIWVGFALLFGLYVGTFMSYSRDLTEPLALGLVVIGCIALFEDKLWGLIPLALALLTKETTIIFLGALMAPPFFALKWRRLFTLALSLIPFLLWQLFLFSQYNTIPLIAGPGIELVPFSGILPYLSADPAILSSLIFVMLAAVFWLARAAKWSMTHWSSPIWWMIVLHGIFVVLLPHNVLEHILHSGRNSMGLIVATAFALPWLAPTNRWFWLAFWVAPTFVWLIPVLRWAPWLSEI